MAEDLLPWEWDGDHLLLLPQNCSGWYAEIVGPDRQRRTLWYWWLMGPAGTGEVYPIPTSLNRCGEAATLAEAKDQVARIIREDRESLEAN